MDVIDLRLPINELVKCSRLAELFSPTSCFLLRIAREFAFSHELFEDLLESG